MAVTFSRSQQSTRTGHKGAIVVDGVDAVVAAFMSEAAEVEGRANDMVVEYAKRAADRMRDLVPVQSGDVKSSITSDPAASRSDGGVYADAGPEHFVARYLEYGTSKMSPRPFVHPAADRVLSEFEKAIRGLSKL